MRTVEDDRCGILGTGREGGSGRTQGPGGKSVRRQGIRRSQTLNHGNIEIQDDGFSCCKKLIREGFRFSRLPENLSLLHGMFNDKKDTSGRVKIEDEYLGTIVEHNTNRTTVNRKGLV